MPPIRATILPQPTPGYALLRLDGLDAPAEGLTLSIQRQQGPDSHLADDGWRRTEAWLRPQQVVRTRGVLDFHLGPEICDRLAGIATIRLRVQEPDVGVVATTVVAWPAMLTSGAIDPTSRRLDDTVLLSSLPPPAPPFEPEPAIEAPPRPLPDLRAERDVVATAGRSNGLGWLIAAFVLLVIGGAGYTAYMSNFQGTRTFVDAEIAKYFPADTLQPPIAVTAPPVPPQEEAKVVEPPKKSIRDTVADYLATKPAPEAMLAKGKEYAAAGEMNGAFLVWRRAAEAQNVEAEMRVAEFYDPAEPQPKTGFAPDGARAADWYERAALAGNAEAQRKYGQLLAKGAPGLPADPAKAKLWLQQAAAQNDAEAKKALESLPK
jgi:hypothetical protein